MNLPNDKKKLVCAITSDEMHENVLRRAEVSGLLPMPVTRWNKKRISLPGLETEWYHSITSLICAWEGATVWAILVEVEKHTRLHPVVNEALKKEMLRVNDKEGCAIYEVKAIVKKIMREWSCQARKSYSEDKE